MSDISHKLPAAWSLSQVARKHANDSQAWAPQALPCTVVSKDGTVLTVSFPINSNYQFKTIKIAQAHSNYFIEPTQANDLGFITPGGAYLGGQTGLGGGAANLYPPHNLTTAIYQPVSNTNFIISDPNAAIVRGPNGAIISDMPAKQTIVVTPTAITISDQYENQIIMASGKIAIKPGAAGKVYVGGDGVTGSYSPVLTTAGPCINVLGRYA